ncbi:hypothetical protein K2173_006595 [Erythroxylum novogranatense]|uniref:Cytochrome b561 domain-containing protein n=1 Tax=Erythroxylum novogranatense TaxID=1862640 RepID=A0AAV8T722_9ROSI|nr:hypothetical protein K2173_006595 [Erythroxylum novogranatense]
MSVAYLSLFSCMMQNFHQLSSLSILVQFVSLLPYIACLQHEDHLRSHKTIVRDHKLSAKLKSEVALHGVLLWISMGFLTPVGILVIRFSQKLEGGKRRAIFYLHVVLQILAVLTGTAGAIMSIKSFENTFDNNHKRIGLALYGAIWVQAGIGFWRPQRGTKRRSTWYCVHWMLGTAVSLIGIINIYTGLDAYHKKVSRSTRLWTTLFTAQVSFMAFFYLFQDKWEYMQKQGVTLGNLESTTPTNQASVESETGKVLVPEPCGKHNALKNFKRRRNNDMGEEDAGKKRRVVVESLGWLTESSILPKKHRAIEGVGASSILELKAQLYKSQEEAKSSKLVSGPDGVEYHLAKKKLTPQDPKNPGVDARALKDKLELKAVNDGSASYAALEKKAELYDKLVRGELSDEEDQEKYCVDFFRKGVELEESQQPQHQNVPATTAPENENENGDNDASTPFGAKFMGPGRTAGTLDRDEHKRFVREVHEQVNEARERVSELKLRRQEQAAANREKLRQAYLRKKLEKLKAEKAAQTGAMEGGS